MKTILLSGGFDPLHIGHVRMIKAASRRCEVIIALNSDDWLMRKKGYVFMPFDERKEILESLEAVSGVTHVDDSDETVCEAINRIRPDCFGNGGDRLPGNTPEHELCEKLSIHLVYGLGGEKIQSSSELVDNAEVYHG